MWRYRSKKEIQIVKKFGLFGGDKKKMVALIKELHLNNDGSYKSSNSIIHLNVACGTIKIQHRGGYVSITYINHQGWGWKRYLIEKEDFSEKEIIDFKEEATFMLSPD